MGLVSTTPVVKDGRQVMRWFEHNANKGALTYVAQYAHQEEFEQDVLVELADDGFLIDAASQLCVLAHYERLVAVSHSHALHR